MAIDMRSRMAEAAASQSENPSAAGLVELNAAVQRTADNWQDPVRAGLSYYRIPDRRMPRGRITLLQNGGNAMEMIEHRGYQSLRSVYGGFKSANQMGDWQRTDPYLGLVQRNGLHEFDGAQIQSLKWHHLPNADSTQSHRLVWQKIAAVMGAGADRETAILTVLPQLEGFDLGEYPCKLCPNRVGGAFTTPESLEAHRSVMHEQNVQTEGTRDAVAAALQSSGTNMNDLVGALTALVSQMAQQQATALVADAPKRSRTPKPAEPTDSDE